MTEPVCYMVKRIAARIFMCAAFLVLVPINTAWANQADYPKLQRALTQLQRDNVPKGLSGWAIRDASGNLVLEKNAGIPFVPASIQKLITAWSYLKSPLFIRSQETLMTGEINRDNPRQMRHLTLHFTGDPFLKSSGLKALFQAIYDRGIRVIDGPIHIVDPWLNTPRYPGGWSQEDLNWYFAPPITAAMIDKNQFSAQVFAGRRPGQPVLVRPSADIFLLSHDVKTVTQAVKQQGCDIHAEIGYQNQVYLSGCWPIARRQGVVKLAARDAKAWVESRSRRLMRSLNLDFESGFIWHSKPLMGESSVESLDNTQSFRAILPAKSKFWQLQEMLQKSDNLAAESMLKQLAFLQHNDAYFDQGVQAVRAIFAAAGFQKYAENWILHDGSGLSRYNLIQADTFSKWLSKVRDDALWQSVLPQGDKLPERFQGLILRAKTGTMSGVSTLAGYFTANSGREYSFVFFANHVPGKVAPVKQFEAEALKQLSRAL